MSERRADRERHRVIGVAILAWSVCSALAAQRVHEEYEPARGVIAIGPEPGAAIDRSERGYTLLLPETGLPRAVVLFLDPGRPGRTIPDSGTFDAIALARGMAVLRVTTGNPLDFLFADDSVTELAARIQRVLHEHRLRELPLTAAGLSLGGTRVLRLAVVLAQHRAQFWLRLAAVAVVDAPLDMARLWDAERRAVAADFHPNAAGEGRWVMFMLEQQLGAPPGERPAAYDAYSPYAHGAPDGGNARYLRDLPLRAYHEPDVDWWIEHRRKDYYSMNSLDQAALINTLRLQGNANAELVTTHRRRAGVARGASPHTWSIVDDADLVDWLLRWR